MFVDFVKNVNIINLPQYESDDEKDERSAFRSVRHVSHRVQTLNVSYKFMSYAILAPTESRNPFYKYIHDIRLKTKLENMPTMDVRFGFS